MRQEPNSLSPLHNIICGRDSDYFVVQRYFLEKKSLINVTTPIKS
ncbi:hypothetical protein FDUTEX481_04938 [Tolypothrix sp. PCC 7601]|nr:hypothetical protein FDUTEX481_04938 [Tolypothrix sp. PCC 7601]